MARKKGLKNKKLELLENKMKKQKQIRPVFKGLIINGHT